MNSTEEIFEKSGAVLKGHFLLSSGLHSPVYWEKFRVLQFPEYTSQLCRMIADNFREAGIQVVAGPTTGGIILAFEVARQLGIRSIYAEKEGNGRTFRRSLGISPGERVLIVDDMIKTGETQNALISLVRKAKAELSAMFTLIAIGDEWKRVLDLPKGYQVEVVINVNPPKRER